MISKSQNCAKNSYSMLLPQCGQSFGTPCSPWTSAVWSSSSSCVLKILWINGHSMQTNASVGFDPTSCFRRCSLNWSLVLKPLMHLGHWKAFDSSLSPSWNWKSKKNYSAARELHGRRCPDLFFSALFICKLHKCIPTLVDCIIKKQNQVILPMTPHHGLRHSTLA